MNSFKLSVAISEHVMAASRTGLHFTVEMDGHPANLLVVSPTVSDARNGEPGALRIDGGAAA
jgi:hypothetical protein